MGYDVIVYFYNPNIYPEQEFCYRLEAQKKLCESLNCKLIIADYIKEEFYEKIKGFENEPEKGARCEVCFKLRLEKTADYARENNIGKFTTSIVISPHKNFSKLSLIGENMAKENGLEYLSIDFKKSDGFFKTNKISKELELYRQNYCGCEYSVRK